MSAHSVLSIDIIEFPLDGNRLFRHHFLSPELSTVTLTKQQQDSLKTAIRCAEIADEYKGRDTVILDLTEITPIVDFFVITTGNSRRQMHAISTEVSRVLKQSGQKRLGREGYDSSTWILQDYGDVVLHIFTQEARELYDLERLWADAKRVDWQPKNVTTPLEP
ncbi:MAG: hypothetical protein Tsb009_08350 [Planctomycetaceae bacterium]